MKRAVVISIILVIAVIGIGQWHWQNQINETAKQVNIELENERNAKEEYLPQAVDEPNQSERPMGEIKAEFATSFQEANTAYEATISQLMLEAEQEYVEVVLTGEQSHQELVDAYQQAFFEAQTEWSETFWREYEQLQLELVENGYWREDAFDFEFEHELILEVTTHTFIQALLLLGQNIQMESIAN
ncbi:hypothetical protein [Halalkalibacter nanhaiisediminis]|uniref:Uncharacterized protein n=1 Tax=Halalkalibacter nanhaiisediminis TaxID=688079 RepID=A0A562QT41_9BACI|nr:hypothetical protein [Halalkalibacter nanhaiisediminis]TWI59912.1 hypothetical protein IQ10_00335 [Halalkalibacter nanhaiisediminis]